MTAMSQSFGAPGPNITERFGHDHTRLDDLLQRFERLNGSDLAAARLVFAEFKAALERHMGCEEEVLFPMFEARTGMDDPGSTAVMRGEHHRLKNYLDQIQVALVQQWPAPILDVLALEDLLMQHSQTEETVLYPALDSMLGSAERARAVAGMELFGEGDAIPAPA
jgi:iron-sulfur cluster repair protein YtfE (RIC family)